MSDLHVELSQIDKSDLHAIRGILSSGFQHLVSENEFSGGNLSEWYSHVIGTNKHMFAIRVSKPEGDVVSRSWLVGICGISDIDWISRHGRLVFVMVDKDGHRCTLQNHPTSLHALQILLSYAFEELGLNKIWASELSNNDIANVLDAHGFIAEGIRRKAAFIKGKYRDESIFSITMKDFMEHK